MEQLEDRTLLSINGIGNDQDISTLLDANRAEPIVAMEVVSESDIISLHYELPELQIQVVEETETGSIISEAIMPGAQQSVVEGEAILPVVPVEIVVPYGSEVSSIEVVADGNIILSDSYILTENPASLIIDPIDHSEDGEVVLLEAEVETEGTASEFYEVVGTQWSRGVEILMVNLTPVQYTDETGTVSYYTSMTLNVNLTESDPSEVGSQIISYRSDEIRPLEQDVANPEALATYVESDLGTGYVTLGLCDPADTYQYVVITNQAMADSTADYTFDDLIAYKQAHGMSATIVTVEDIYANYTGTDQPERIRNFITDAYNNWETDFVLLGGDTNIIPYRSLYVAISDLTSSERSVPSDLYYQCLDGNFNNDGDSYWGEPTDGIGGGEVDLSAEVYVGRVSAETTTEMANWVYKNIAYENTASSDYRSDAVMLGEHLGFGGVAEYATNMMEEIRLGSSAHGYTTVGFASEPSFTTSTLYDSSSYTWSSSTLINSFNSDTHGIYNHLGHANTSNVMKVSNSTVDSSLTNDNFFFLYSQGCYPGEFPNNAIAEHFTTSTRTGAAAVVFNSRYGWGKQNSTDGASQRPAREFWDALFGEGLNQLGVMNADSHEDNIWGISDKYIRYTTYETNLFGDPAAKIVSFDLTVEGCTPTTGSTVSTPPTDFTITLSDSYSASSVDAGDLLVNGVGADSLTLTDSQTVTFHYATSPVTAQGMQNMEIPAGAILRDSDDNPILAWSSSFRYDALAVAVVATDPADGSLTTIPFDSLLIDFNEPVDPASIGADDLVLSQGSVVSASMVDADTVRYTLTGIDTEGPMTFTLDNGVILDAWGNPGASYTGNFNLDVATASFPTPLTASAPLGSLIYSGTASGTISPGSDTDSFTIDLDAGQTLSALVQPDAGLQPTITITGPGGADLGSAASSGAGVAAMLQAVPAETAGTYTVTVGSVGEATSGEFTLELTLNAALEEETTSGVTNDTFATAQDITGSFMELGESLAQRGAVTGNLLPPTLADMVVDSEDFESGSLGSQWSTYSSSSSYGRIQVTGDYGTAGGSYALTMDVNTSSNYNLNEAIWTVDLSGVVSPALSFYAYDWNDTDTSFSGDFTGHYNADGVAISDDGITWHPIWNAYGTTSWQEITLDLAAKAAAHGITLGANFQIKFQQYDNCAITTDGRGFDQIEITTPAVPGEDWYRFAMAAGEKSTLVLENGTTTMALDLYDSSGNLLSTSAPTEDLAAVINNFPATYSGDYYACVSGYGGDYRLLVTKNADFDMGMNVSSGMAQLLSVTPGEATTVLGHCTDGDYYKVQAVAGDPLVITTLTPAGGPYEFVNEFDPVVELYDPSGTLVASDDNSASDGRNVKLAYTATVDGEYTIRVLAATEEDGEYVLLLNALHTTLTVPSDVWETDGSASATLDISVPYDSDLVVDLVSDNPGRIGVPATVTIPAGQTSVTIPLSITDDSLLQGPEDVTISATAGDYGNSVGVIRLHDDETTVLTVDLPADATEGDGVLAAAGTITVDTPPDRDVTIHLLSSDESEIAVPESVLLPAGQTSVTFDVTVREDTLIDDTQTATVTASVENWTSGQASMDVLDSNRTLNVTLPSDTWEGQGVLAGMGMVEIGGTLSYDLPVFLYSDTTTELQVPTTVTILAGQTSATFDVTIVDDAARDGAQTAMVTAMAPGFLGTETFEVTIHDNELDYFEFAAINNPQTASVPFAAEVYAKNIDDETILVYGQTVTLTGTSNSGSVPVTPGDCTFTDGVWAGDIMVDAVASGVVLSVDNGAGETAQSNAFDVVPGSMVTLQLSAIASPQYVHTPFDLTMTALDANGYVATDYNATMDIRGLVNTGTLSSIVISEIEVGATDRMEFTNVSGEDLDIGGWTIWTFDSANPETPQALLTIPEGTICSAGGVFVLEEMGTSPGAYPYFYSGTNLNWTPMSQTGVLLMDRIGSVRDFVAASALDPTVISTPVTVVPQYWQGDSIDHVDTETLSYQRIGNTDHNDASDWVIDRTPNVGTLNTGLDTTFTGGTVAIEPASFTMVNGVCTDTITVLQAVSDMYLQVDAGNGDVFNTNAFEVLPPTVTLFLPTDVTEGGATVAAVSVSSAKNVDQVIHIESSDPSRLSVPSEVILPAGQTTVMVPVTVVDNDLLDGPQDITLTATATDYAAGVATIHFHDNETAALTVTLPENVTESDGVLLGAGVISVSAAPSQDIVIRLNSDNTHEVTVPTTVILPAGQTTVAFDLTILDDTLIDDTQVATITATVENWTTGTATMNVLDDDRTLTVTLPEEAWEGESFRNCTVEIGGTLPTDLVISLTTNDTSELSLPTTVTIFAGQTTATFTATMLTDNERDGVQTTNLTATVDGFSDATETVVVHDADPDHFEWNVIDGPQQDTIPFSATAQAINIDGETILVYSTSATLIATGDSGTVPVAPQNVYFSDGVWTGNITIDTVDTNVTLSLDDGSGRPGTSNVFDVVPGPVAGFQWSTIDTIQYANAPITVTLTAVDANGFTVTDFDGTADLSGWTGDVTSTVEVLSFITYADTAEEYPNTLQAISTYFTDYNVTTTTATDPALLEAALVGKDVLLIPEQESAGSSTLSSLATSFSPVLNDFVSAGGTVIVCSYQRAEHLFLSNSGLMNINDYSYSSSMTLTKDADTVLNEGVSVPFTGRYIHRYSTSHNAEVSLRYYSSTTPVVLSRDIGDGHAIMIGTDYSVLGTGMDRVIANAMQWAQGTSSPMAITPTTTGNFVDGVWTGSVTVQETGTSVYLQADYSDGVTGPSNTFDVVPLTLDLDIADVDPDETAGTVTATISLPGALNEDLVVDLVSSNPDRVGVPTSVTIPAGQASVSVPLAIVDNALLDGAEAITIDVTAPNAVADTGTLTVHDDETALLTVSLPSDATEGDGLLAGAGTLTSSAAPTRDIVVQLASDNEGEVLVPATVVLPAGQTTVTFDLTIVDDTLIDDTQTATITAAVENWTGGLATMNVLDNDRTMTMTLGDGDWIWEGQNAYNFGTIEIGGTLTTDLVIALNSSDEDEVQVPATVTIPAGQTTVLFDVTAGDDTDTDGMQTYTITASNAGFSDATAMVMIHDDEFDHLAWDAIAGSQIAGEPFAVTVLAQNIDNETIPFYSGTASLAAAGDSGTLALTPSNCALFGGLWSGSVTIDAVDTNVTLTADDGQGHTADSNAFDLVAGPAVDFRWSTIDSTQYVNVPFPATLTAVDAHGYVATNFNGTVDLSGLVGNAVSHTIFDDPVHTNVGTNSSGYTLGYSFTPNTDILVTHFSHYFGSKVSLWTDSGALLASEVYVGTPGTWAETELATPIQLYADTTYRIGSYFDPGDQFYWRTDMGSAFPDGIINQSYEIRGDAFPTSTDSYRWWFVSMRYDVGSMTSVATVPTSATFSDGIWTGDVTVLEEATDMHLLLDDGSGLTAESNSFDVLTTPIDFGDAPASYSTLSTDNGAKHIVVPGFHLGSAIDADADGQPSAGADADDTTGIDDEDGVVFAGPLYLGMDATIDVTASAAGRLDAWIDFNGDGDWNDAGEKIFDDVALAAGTNSLTVTVPATASLTDQTFARFRFSSTGGLFFTSIASDGEVEDYAVAIELAPPTVDAEPATTPGTENAISWSAVPGADAYYVECDNNADFSSPEANSGWITGTSHTFVGLMDGETYYYRVKSRQEKLGGTDSWIQTTEADFAMDVLDSTSITTQPGDVVLTSTGTVLFADNFEDGDYNGWTNAGGSYTREVTNATAAEGTYSFTQIGGGAHGGGVTHTLDNITPDRIDFSVRSSNTSNSDGYFVLNDSLSDDDFDSSIFFLMTNEGEMGLYEHGIKHYIPYSVNQWYDISLIFDWSARTVDYYVDDALIESDIPFRDISDSYASVIHLYNFSSDSQAWWDDIIIQTGTGSGYVSSGSIVSAPIASAEWQSWGTLNFNNTTPTDTTLTVDVLPATGTTPIPGYENVNSGTDLSGITETSIRLRANLATTDTAVTPALHDWTVDWQEANVYVESAWSNIVSSTQGDVQRLPGDANLDGVVDGSDATILSSNWQKTGVGWAGGDFNDDGIVDGSDATILSSNWQKTWEDYFGVPCETLAAASDMSEDVADLTDSVTFTHTTALVGPQLKAAIPQKLYLAQPLLARDRFSAGDAAIHDAALCEGYGQETKQVSSDQQTPAWAYFVAQQEETGPKSKSKFNRAAQIQAIDLLLMDREI